MTKRVSGTWAVGVLGFVLMVCGPVWGESPYPVAWSRQLGTSGEDVSWSVAVDNAGNAFISGYTYGSLGGGNAGLGDAFLAKYDPAGNLLWTRQLGTSANDYSFSVAVDGAGNAFMSGYTEGSLGGTSAGGSDAFLAKYDSSGNLLWTRQLGTSAYDYSNSVAVDGAGNAFISGHTYGSLGGTNAGGDDAFLAKYDAAGNLVWTRQLGTSGWDESYSVAVDGAGNAFISGWTWGSLGGNRAGSIDAFLAKYDMAGNLLWTRQLGTWSADYSVAVAVDGAGNAFISGYTGGSLGGTNPGSEDAFLAKYDSAGNLLWTQQLGTSSIDRSESVAVDGAGNAFVSGWTQGDLGGSNAGWWDAFLAKYDAGGNLLWTQQLGTSSGESSYSVAVGVAGNAFISGRTVGSLGGTNAGGWDAFLVKYATPEPLVLAVEIDIKPASPSNTINLNSNGVVDVAILGSEDLDVSEIDQETLDFAAASPRVKGRSGKGSFRDVNGDSYEDLVVHFLTQDVELGQGSEEATLTGQLLDGTEFFGTDDVRIVGNSD